MLPRIGSLAYHNAVRLAAKFGQHKAQKWVAGRAEIPSAIARIKQNRLPGQQLVWLHAASLGEFEQGMPVLEMIRAQRPNTYLVVTFFSPSGYEARKDYPTADAVLYLPDDNATSAAKWVNELKPNLAIFVKYEFWPYHLQALRQAAIPTVLIAGSFRKSQPFFQWYGQAWRKLLLTFDQLIVQTEKDAELLREINLPAEKISLGGDPRTDRVLQLAAQPFKDKILADFTSGHHCLLAGSVWAPDVAVLSKLRSIMPANWKLILAPHQLKEAELADWAKALGADRYTDLRKASGSVEYQPKQETKVLLLDTIGILSRAYRYASLAYIGGGFGSGLHNTLEPMAYGLPVIFGPYYSKFPEAVTGIVTGSCFTISSAEELISVFQKLLVPADLNRATQAVNDFTMQASGATSRTFNALKKFLD